MAATKVKINVIEHFVKHYLWALVPAETVALTAGNGKDVKDAAIAAAWSVLAPVFEASYIWVKTLTQKSVVEKEILELLGKLADQNKTASHDVEEVKAVIKEIAPTTTPEAPATPAS
jgi:hypothetical protein